MKVLSVNQPYAWLLFYPLDRCKTVENRPWNTDYRGPLLIHAGKVPNVDFSTDRCTIDLARLEQYLSTKQISVQELERWVVAHGRASVQDIFLYGGIIGIVTLRDVGHDPKNVWALPNLLQWQLRNPVPLPFTRCSGRYGLFDVTLPRRVMDIINTYR